MEAVLRGFPAVRVLRATSLIIIVGFVVDFGELTCTISSIASFTVETSQGVSALVEERSSVWLLAEKLCLAHASTTETRLKCGCGKRKVESCRYTLLLDAIECDVLGLASKEVYWSIKLFEVVPVMIDFFECPFVFDIRAAHLDYSWVVIGFQMADDVEMDFRRKIHKLHPIGCRTTDGLGLVRVNWLFHLSFLASQGLSDCEMSLLTRMVLVERGGSALCSSSLEGKARDGERIETRKHGAFGASLNTYCV